VFVELRQDGVLPEMVGVGNGFTVITAEPVMSFIQFVVVLVALTVYVPAVVCKPKLIALPVPATGKPIAVVPPEYS
jgi:hypothetical protein